MEIRVKGVDDLMFNLRQIAVDLSSKYMVVALTAGAEIVTKRAEQLAPHKTGAGAKSLHTLITIGSPRASGIGEQGSGSVVQATITSDMPHMYWQNNGWQPTKRVVKGGRKVTRVATDGISKANWNKLPMRELLKGGAHLKKVPGKHFMERAIHETSKEVESVIIDTLKAQIQLFNMSKVKLGGSQK